jgi:uncharacterized protein YgiM (DUF1202 family)
MRKATLLLVTLGLLTGAPVFAAEMMEVYDLSTKARLNVRKGPSTKDAVIGSLAKGEQVETTGCTGEGNAKWCAVSLKNGTKGFASGQFLKAMAMAPAAAAKPPAFMTGKLKCEMFNGSPVAECTFGLMRIGPGARLQIIWPSATKRMFGVFGGAVTSGDGSVRAVRKDDGTLEIALNPKGAPGERYMVPADVIPK